MIAWESAGSTNITRPSRGDMSVTAAVFPIRARGTAMCAPLLPRTARRWWKCRLRRGESSCRIRSLHGPVAFTTTAARTCDGLTAERIANGRPGDSPALRMQRGHAGVIQHDGARRHRAQRVREGEPGVVRRGVEVGGAANETIGAKHRLVARARRRGSGACALSRFGTARARRTASGPHPASSAESERRRTPAR